MAPANYEKKIYQPFFPRLWHLGRVYARGSLENGLREGSWTFFYLSGKVQMEGGFLRGKKEGPWVKYWENGNPQSRGAFVEGKMNGVWTDWYPDGGKAQETEWDMGKQKGPATIFDRKTGKPLPGKSVKAAPPPDSGYTLMTDRDVLQAMRYAARAGMMRSWKGLVGKRIASLVEPWQAACWLLLLPVFYRLFDMAGIPGILNIPLDILGSSLAGVGLAVLALVHDHFTRPDFGTPKPAG
ncbi:MAG: hypothetical protein AB1921_09455 [Thermodesulfobacteriota bacterium]